MKKTRIAILHDYFDKKGGGERLVLNLARAMKADVYTGFIEPEKTFSTKGIRIKSLGIWPWLPVLLRNPLIARKFEKYDFHDYDILIVSGVWCISASKNHPSILYCHTPPRFMYDLRDYFLGMANPILRIVLRLFIKYWKPKDQLFMTRFDVICPNSANVSKRILRYYGGKVYNKCKVVYTGIETQKFHYSASEDFYLSTSRLDPLKRVDLLIKAFADMPGKELIITGTGPEKTKLQKLANGLENIYFTGNISEKKMLSLYSRCKAVIVAAKDEDLGLSAIEAQAAGKPVLAVKEGGLTETVNNKTGVFFEPDINSLKNAVEKMENMNWNRSEIRKNAARFDINIFIKNMKKIINDTIEKKEE